MASYKGTRKVANQDVSVSIYDTSGDPNLGRNREAFYEGTDCFMLCVAVNNRESLQAVQTFAAEIKKVCPRASILLIGTKTDLPAAVT